MNYWEQLLDKAKANHLNLDFDKIKLALGFAEESHQGQYRKAEDILMKYIVNNEDNLDEYALLKTLYTKENNKQKLENLKKILRNKM